MIYQELALAPHLSVEANVMLGQERVRLGTDRSPRAPAHCHRGARAARASRYPARGASRSPGRGCPAARRGGAGPGFERRVIVFDEPTSSLSEGDAERLFAIIDRLRNRGLGIIYISHFLEEVRRVAQTYTVLRDGRAVATGSLAGTEMKSIITQMVGRDLDELFPRVPHAPGEPILELDGLARLEGGEPGEPGAPARRDPGHRGLGRCRPDHASARRVRAWAGRLGADPRPSFEGGHAAPRARIAQGVGFLSEDRKTEGLALGRSIEDNMTYSVAQAARSARLAAAQRAARRGGSLDGAACTSMRPARPDRRRPLGRQPAEGGPGAAASPAGRRPAARRADARHRRRLEGRDLSPDRRAGRQGQGDPGRQLVPSRAVRDLRPDRRDVARSAVRGPTDIGMDRARGDGSRHPHRAACREPGRIAFAAIRSLAGRALPANQGDRRGRQARADSNQELPGFALRGTLGWVWTVFGPFLGLVLITLLFAALTRESGRFLTLDNWRTIAVQSVIVGTAALGMTIIMIAGGIDLSVGSTVALVTVCMALFVKKVDPSLPDSLREWKLLLPLALLLGVGDRRDLRGDQRRA